MTDFHSHILPGMDDGSPDAETSCKMLKLSREQGVERIVLTPHFYPESEKPEAFLARREKCRAELLREIEKQGRENFPKIYLGAEVAFFEGISQCSEISELCIEGTNYLLVEMPFADWTSRMADNLFRLRGAAGVQIVLAHVDRYFGFADKKLLKELAYNDVMFQVNAEAFEHFGTRRKVLGMIAGGEVRFLGSDCHNLTSRKPNMETAANILAKKADPETVEIIGSAGRWLLDKAKPL